MAVGKEITFSDLKGTLSDFARRMFDQILVSCAEEGTGASLHLSNEHNFAVAGTLAWKLLTFGGEVLAQGELPAQVPALTALKLATLDFTQELAGPLKRERYLAFAFSSRDDGAVQTLAPARPQIENGGSAAWGSL